MKKLTKREAMEALLSGKDVDYYYSDGNKGEYSPLSWDEEKGVVDDGGGGHSMDSYTFALISEPVEEVWVNFYGNSRSTHLTEVWARNMANSADRVAVHMREVREEDT